MKCSKCGKEMRKGYLFCSKDGAFSFANEVPGVFQNAKKADGFVEVTKLKPNHRTNVAAALTHDIGIHLCEEKYGDCNGKLQEKEGPAIAARLLGELGFEKQVSERVQYLIAHHHTYHNIDGLDYQILVEADFLVNLFEDNLSKEAAVNAYQNIFKTATGKRICKEMFAL